MATEWRVRYRLQPAAVVDEVPAYERLGLSLEYEEGKLTTVSHHFSAPDTADRTRASALSQKSLVFFWSVLEYRRGVEVKVRGSSTERLSQTPSAGAVAKLGSVRVAASAVICHQIQLPEEATLLRPRDRLEVWLRLAIKARDPSRPVDGIRNYYMIWEDMRGRPDASQPDTAQDLKYARDFVSHGEELKDKSLLAFLDRELGKPVNRFDPTDTEHKDFADRHRARARALVEGELEKLL